MPNNEKLRNKILSKTYYNKFTIHPGITKIYQDLRKLFWWNGMKRDIASFVARCLTYQKVKIEHQKPVRLLQPLNIPEWECESISMDLVIGLPRTPSGYDAAWIIFDRLTKSTHILPIRISWSLYKLVEVYVKEILRLHGILTSIISDRDPRFTSKFWVALQEVLCTKLHFSIAYHP